MDWPKLPVSCCVVTTGYQADLFPSATLDHLQPSGNLVTEEAENQPSWNSVQFSAGMTELTHSGVGPFLLGEHASDCLGHPAKVPQLLT